MARMLFLYYLTLHNFALMYGKVCLLVATSLVVYETLWPLSRLVNIGLGAHRGCSTPLR